MKNKTSWCRMAPVLAVFCAASVASAAANNPVPARAKADPLLPSINILNAEKAPVVDGVLDDPCWAKAEESHVFADYYDYPESNTNTFRICQKDEVIYLAIRVVFCKPDGKGQQPAKDPKVLHDGNLWNGYACEMFIDIDNADTPGYYQFVLTPFDVTGDFYCFEQRDPEPRWEPKYQVKSQWTNTGWTIEYGIPLAAFDRSKTMYRNFGMNLHPWAWASWSPGHSEGWHNPMKFGEVRGLEGRAVTTNTPGLFRAPYMKVNERVIKARANPSLVPEKPPELVGKPAVKASGDTAEISFEVNTRTDVAVWIEDARGERVRHLAAGMLGPNAPAPLQKNSLKQTVAWDYLDDFGRKAPPGAYRAKVGVGSKAALDKEIGRNDTPKEVCGLAVGADGAMFTIGGIRDEWSEVMKYDRDGKFVSMLLPPPADVPVDKLKGLNIIDYGPDGQVRFGSHRMATTLPNLDQPMPHTLMVNSRGQIILFGCEYPSGPGRLFKINADGSLPDDFIGPYITDVGWLTYFSFWAKRFHFALDPSDGETVYVSGLKEMHSKDTWRHPGTPNAEVLPNTHKETFYNAVSRVRWDPNATIETFAGKRNTFGIAHSDKPGEFFDPQGIAFDADNNLWVCDRRNHRIQVLDRDGKFLRQFPHTGPYEVRFHRKTGCAYVMGIEGEPVTLNTMHDLVSPVATITKYDRGQPPKVLARLQLPGTWSYWLTMALDESRDPPEIKMVWTGPGREPNDQSAYRILRIRDLGDRFAEPELVVGADPPEKFYRIAAGWDSDILCVGGETWIDANTGRRLPGVGHGGKEVAAARDGRWVVRCNFNNEYMAVYPESWPTNAEAKAMTNWPIVPPSLTRAGERGFCVAPNGDVYVARYYNWTESMSSRTGESADTHVGIDRYTIDGKLIGERVVYELSQAAHSPVADIRGNIYVSDNFGRRIGQFYEDDIASNLPAWVPDFPINSADWNTLRSGNKVDAGIMKFVWNPLVKAVGSIYKFGPKGGGVLWRSGQAKYQPDLVIHKPETNNAGELVRYMDWGYEFLPLPKRPATHWSATMLLWGEYGIYPAWLEGVEWEFLGASPSWGRYTKGHEACTCFNLRFCADDFGRIYVPAAHRNTIRMIDTAGNEVLRIGRYGNLASGPGQRLKEPDIPLWFPTGTALSKRYLYVVESRLARVLRIKLGYEQEAAEAVTVR